MVKDRREEDVSLLSMEAENLFEARIQNREKQRAGNILCLRLCPPYSLDRILNIRLASVRESLSKGILLLRASYFDVVNVT